VAETKSSWVPPEVASLSKPAADEGPQLRAATPGDETRWASQDTWMGRIESSIRGTATDLGASIQGRYTAAQKAFDTRYSATPGDGAKPVFPALLSAAGAAVSPSPGEALNSQRKAELAVGGAQSLKEAQELKDVQGNYEHQWLPIAEPGQTNFLGHSDAVQALMKPITKEDDDTKVPFTGGTIPLSAVKAVYQPVAKTVNSLVTPENALITGLTAGAGEIPAIGKAVSTFFGVQMGAGSLQAVKHLQELNSDPNATGAQKVSAGIEAGIGVAMAKSLLTHAISGEAKAQIETLPPEQQLAAVSKEVGTSPEQLLKDASDQMELDFKNSKVEVPPEHVPVTIRREDGTEYQAGMAGYQDGVPVITNLETHSTTLLGDKENIVGDMPAPELWERTSAGNKLSTSPFEEWVPPEVRGETTPTANVTVMGSHTQVEIPGEGDRPAFSGTPEQARDAGFDVPTDGLEDGSHKVPIEPPLDPNIIGITKKLMNQRRVAAGLPEFEPLEVRSDQVTWDKTLAKVAADPTLPARNIEELRSGNRVPTDADEALNRYRIAELEVEKTEATNRVNSAIEKGEVPDMADRQKVEELLTKQVDAMDVIRASHAETGRSLRAIQLMTDLDFSAPKLISERQALSGEKLTPEKMAETRDIAERVKTTQAALEKITAERDALLAEKTSKAAHEELVKKVAEETEAPEAEKPARAKTPSKLREYIKTQAEAARQRVRERTGELHAGIDPTHLTDLAIIGVEHLTRAGENLAAFTKRMADDVGEWVKPYIEQIFGEAKKMRDSMAKDFTPKEVVDAIGKKLSTGGDVTPEFRKLAREAIELGMTDRNRVIDFVHDQIRETAPEMDRRAVQDAISGYGKFRELSKDEITQKLADVSAQLRLVSKLEDILAGKEPEKTGVERRAPSEEETALRNKIAELEKKANEDVAVSAALTREKTAIEKQITELERKTSTGDLSTKGQKVNRPAADPELELLKQRRDQLNRKLTDMRREAAPKADPNQTRLKAMKTRLENSTKEFQRRLDEGDFTAKKPRAPITDPAVEKAKAENLKAKQAYQDALARDRNDKAGIYAHVVNRFLKVYRGFILSSPVVIAKISGMSVFRAISHQLDEVAGEAIHRLPGVSQASKYAPIEGGGYQFDAEVQALTKIALAGHDLITKLTGKETDIEILWGKHHADLADRSTTLGKIGAGIDTAADYPGQVHAAIKAPIKRLAYEFAVAKGINWARNNGFDVYDPAVIAKIKIAAYEYANRNIAMQDSAASKKMGQLFSIEYDKATGEATPGSVTAHLVGGIVLPVKKVPVNIVAEAFEYLAGTETGSIRLAKALYQGVETLKDNPAQADMIMRELKKGVVGKAILLLGFFTAESIGGLYDPKNKKRPDETQAGEVRIPWLSGLVKNGDVPAYLLHHPMMEDLQFSASIFHGLNAPLRIPTTHKGMLAALAKGEATPLEVTANALFDLAAEVPLARTATTVAKLANSNTRPAAAKDILQGIVVPQGLSWVARYTDKNAQGEPIKREATTTVEHIKEAVPGLRETLPVKK
jgi:hypothetical protein